MGKDRRLRKLESPLHSPGERKRQREARELARQKAQEIEERERQWFEAIAEAHPERVDDYLEALEEQHLSLEDLPEDASRVEVRDATDAYFEARQLFEQGWVSGHSCEDCGRGAVHFRETGYEGTCGHCGGVTSYYGYWHKRVISIEQLTRELEAVRSMGYEGQIEHMEGLILRRRMEVNEDERKGDQ